MKTQIRKLIQYINDPTTVPYKYQGLCFHLPPKSYRFFRSIVHLYPNYSGDPKFPIGTARQYWVTENKWNQTTEYGQQRLTLTEWFAKALCVKILADDLLDWSENEPPYNRYGICTSISHHTYNQLPYTFIRNIMTKWPDFSGNEDYPVPYYVLCPEIAYNESINKWDKTTKYGRSRRDLAKFLATELLSTELNNAIRHIDLSRFPAEI